MNLINNSPVSQSTNDNFFEEIDRLQNSFKKKENIPIVMNQEVNVKQENEKQKKKELKAKLD